MSEYKGGLLMEQAKTFEEFERKFKCLNGKNQNYIIGIQQALLFAQAKEEENNKKKEKNN